MRRWLANMLLALFGWRAVGMLPESPKGVLVVAPHTSNWDFLVMLMLAAALGVKTTWMGKHTLFRPPFGWLMWRLVEPIYRRGVQRAWGAPMAPDGARMERWASMAVAAVALGLAIGLLARRHGRACVTA